jgi:hypothetical protein
LTKSGGFLHFDGIYQAAWGIPEWIYLRFYPHGKVLFMASNVNSPGKDMLNEKWREPHSPVVKKGDYQVTNSKIELNFGFMKGPWRGRIHNDTITFYFADESGQKEHERTFWYTKGPEYAQRPEPLKQLEESKRRFSHWNIVKRKKLVLKKYKTKSPRK